MDAQTLGLAAEDFAAHYLKRKGYRIRNQTTAI
jgi:Holliday junction resolvase-like predicted endonuclease